MLPSVIPKLPTDSLVRGFLGVWKLLLHDSLPRVGLHSYLFCLSFYLLYFVLTPFEENGSPFWVPDVLQQHSEVVLWNFLSVQLIFWWICGGESDLPILFLCHLRTAASQSYFLTAFIHQRTLKVFPWLSSVIMLQRTWQWRYIVNIFVPFSLNIHPEVILLNHIIAVFYQSFEQYPYLFHSVCIKLLFFFPQNHQHFLSLVLFIISIVTGMRLILIVVLIFISLIICNFEQPFMHSLSICFFFFMKSIF